MLLALSKFLPRVFHKKSTGKSDKSANNESTTGENTKPCTCRVVLLDESELSLDVKVSMVSLLSVYCQFIFLGTIQLSIVY